MKRSKQLFLDSIFMQNHSKGFGGSMLVGKRKSARPIATKKSMHVVVKSQKAKAQLSFLTHRKVLDSELHRLSTKWNIKISHRVWLMNHIHIILKSATCLGFKNFLREFCATIVKVLGQRTQQTIQDFFDYRPFTRILEYGRDLRTCVDYLVQNELENFGLRKYKQALSVRRNKRNYEVSDISY